MKRKTHYLLAISMLLLMLASCNNDADKVKDFAQDFAQAVAHNDVKKVKSMYPDAAQCDSFALHNYSPDSMVIQEMKQKGLYKVFFTPEITATIKRASDGTMTVVNSKGLFAFSDGIDQLAISTGWFQHKMDDLQRQKQLADTAFLDFLSSKVSNSLNATISATEWSFDMPEGGTFGPHSSEPLTLHIKVRNASSMPLKGSDYYVTSVVKDNSGEVLVTKTLKGVDVPPAGSSTITFRDNDVPVIEGGYLGSFDNTVHLKVSKAKMISLYLQPTGNEYEEYKSQKSK